MKPAKVGLFWLLKLLQKNIDHRPEIAALPHAEKLDFNEIDVNPAVYRALEALDFP